MEFASNERWTPASGAFADEKEARFPLTRGLYVLLSAYSGLKTSD